MGDTLRVDCHTPGSAVRDIISFWKDSALHAHGHAEPKLSYASTTRQGKTPAGHHKAADMLISRGVYHVGSCIVGPDPGNVRKWVRIRAMFENVPLRALFVV
jgi:hypothetical protein